MKKSKFTDHQYCFAFEAGRVGNCSRRGVPQARISQLTFYRWKKQFTGFGTEELRRLKQLEEENKRLKSLVADLSLDSRSYRTFSQKSSEACSFPECVDGAMNCYRISERRACRLLGLARSSHRYQSTKDDQAALRCV